MFSLPIIVTSSLCAQNKPIPLLPPVDPDFPAGFFTPIITVVRHENTHMIVLVVVLPVFGLLLAAFIASK